MTQTRESTLREYPWHNRPLTSEHCRWFENLADLHSMTYGWTKDLGLDRPSEYLKRLHSSEGLRLIAPLDEAAEWNTSLPLLLERVLDETLPDDVLGRLEGEILTAQVETLRSLTTDIATADWATRLNQLEQSSWKSGRDSATRRWPILSRGVRHDLQAVLTLFFQGPLSRFPRQDAFLVRRRVPREVILEWLTCPHHCTEVYPTLGKSAPLADGTLLVDLLCHLYGFFSRGFLYGLNPLIVVDHVDVDGNDDKEPNRLSSSCHQRWDFAAT